MEGLYIISGLEGEDLLTRVNEKCAPYYLQNEDEFVIIKRIFDDFVAQLEAENSDQLRDVEYILSEEYSQRTGGAALNRVYQEMLQRNQKLPDIHENFSKYTKTYILKKLNYQLTSFSRQRGPNEKALSQPRL